MGLFGNKDKAALEHSMDAVLTTLGANRGNLESSSVAERVADAEARIAKMCAKGKSAEVRTVLDAFSAREVPIFAFGSTPADARAAMEKKKAEGRDQPSNKAEQAWRDVIDRFRSLT